MPRRAADHGTYRAYLRCRQRAEGACPRCLEAKSARNGSKSKVGAREAAAPAPPVVIGDAPLTAEGHVSRLEVLKEMLQGSRETLAALRKSDPARAYLLMREQREILSEIADLQGNGQVKGVTLADQLAAAKADRAARRAAGA